MAYQIIGYVQYISATEQIPTKNGTQLQKRTLVLIQQRYNPQTGEVFDPNFPTFEFTNDNCRKLDSFKAGDLVKVKFDINGYKYIDRQTQAEKYSSSLRGFSVETYVAPQTVMQAPQQMQPAPQQMQQAPQNYQAQGGYPAYQNQGYQMPIGSDPKQPPF